MHFSAQETPGEEIPTDLHLEKAKPLCCFRLQLNSDIYSVYIFPDYNSFKFNCQFFQVFSCDIHLLLEIFPSIGPGTVSILSKYFLTCPLVL